MQLLQYNKRVYYTETESRQHAKLTITTRLPERKRASTARNMET